MCNTERMKFYDHDTMLLVTVISACSITISSKAQMG